MVKKQTKEIVKMSINPVEQRVPVTNAELDKFLLGAKLDKVMTAPQKTMFKAIAIRQQLDPFLREVYALPYKVREKNEKTGYYEETGETDISIVTGYQVYIQRAERSGRLKGWHPWLEGKLGDWQNFKACIEIERKDFKKPFYHEVFFNEYGMAYPKNGIPYVKNKTWKEKPRTMIRKVVIGQGFRMAFSQELGGMPYLREELPQLNYPETKEIASPEKQIEQKNNVKKAEVKAEKKEEDKIKDVQLKKIHALQNELTKMNPKFNEAHYKRCKKKNTGKEHSNDMEPEQRSAFIRWLEDRVKEEKDLIPPV